MKVELARAQKLLDQKYPDPDKAIKLLDPLLRRESKHWLVYYFLGIAQIQKSNYEKAIGYFEKSIGVNAENAQTYLLVARCYYELQDFENAERYGKATIQLNQELLDAWMFMGKLYWDYALLNKAIQCYTIANKLDPKNYLIAYNIGQIYADQGDYKKALELYDITLQMEPKLIDAGIKKAQIYQSMGEHEQAEEAVQKVLELDSENLLALSVLSLLYRAMGRYTEAIELNEQLLERYPNDGNVRVNYALCLVETGQYDEAEKNYLRALKDTPETQQSLSNYLMGIHYNPKRTKEEIFEAHSLWDTYYAPKERPERPVPANKNKDKKLRVGFLSGGFKKHPVGWMITSALEQLPKDEIATYIYTTDTYHDSLTKRIREASAKWTSVVGYSDEVVAQIIKDDEIDILVELSGHSSGNRLKTVALEPAPITIKWVGGLFNTSGLKSMDYLLTDAKESPEGEETFYTEKLVRMPDDYVCYTLPNYDIPVAEAPVLENGYITFGCFNNPTKINTELLTKWAEILKQVPGSRLYLKSKQYDTELVRRRVADHLADCGIERERVMFDGYSLHNELLEHYNKVDIALDPWPYSGGLTTIEALWMGVPVVTNSGPTFAGRHSTSHITNAGFPEWVTDNWDDYIRTAVSLAGDPEELAKVRAELREHLLYSPVCDAPRFADNLASAFREMWIQRVKGYEKDLPEGEWQDHIWVESLDSSRNGLRKNNDLAPLKIDESEAPDGGKFVHISFNHVYAKSLSDMLEYVNKQSNQKHILFVERHQAILNYDPDISNNADAQFFDAFQNLKELFDQCLRTEVSAIYIHGLFYDWQSWLVKKIARKKHISWIIWGGDLYNPIKKKKPFHQIAKHIDAILTPIGGDIELCNKVYGKRPDYPFGYPYPGLYGNIDLNMSDPEKPQIVVGNSGDISNNHKKILELLSKKKDIQEYELLLPVAYSFKPSYKRELMDKIEELGLQDNTRFLEDFINPEEYFGIINRCEMLILAHERQQAVGNILMALYCGKSVFLKEEIVLKGKKVTNPSWEFLSEAGFHINSMNVLKSVDELSELISTTKTYAKEHRQIIDTQFSLEARAGQMIQSSELIYNKVNGAS
ncbi:TDP-N-acetylfucosamine:lipid II N-acetylfucosaminyltransferase [Gracilimonas sp. BCB1]|uniref:TDP-N-acetylfucosamine:lipid II N-acetylfucosaminyltransferase n=1 Tax=Gracilimonas sp. BCB1 TaxID=3152362 RepID=UPI0032D9810D